MRLPIHQSWSGAAVTHDPITFIFETVGEDVIWHVTAPYFGDPAPTAPAGEPLWKLWDYEVVEAFFLNDDNQYLEVEVGSHGQHLVLLLNTKRNVIRHSLPLDVTTTITGNTWRAKATIPLRYFPPKVTKFNGYAMHGLGKDRHYEALYPADSKLTEPEFHALEYFQPMDFDALVKNFNSKPTSQLWEDSMNRLIRLPITSTWSGAAITHDPVTFTLEATARHVIWHVQAPYFGDPSPTAPAGQALWKLWEYEVVEVFFLNDDGKYLEVEVGPHGQHLVLLLNTKRNVTRHSLPLDVTTTITGNTWQARAMIPLDYFPPNVTKINGYAMHRPGDARHFESLYPADLDLEEPEFHALKYFKPLDFDSLVKDAYQRPMSRLWEDSIHGLIRLPITRTWSGAPLTHPPVSFVLEAADDHVLWHIEAPYFNDPPPLEPAGERQRKLWEHEVVIAFFLNDNAHYLEVIVGPHGQYLVGLHKKKGLTVRHSLPLEVCTNITGDTWTATAKIPLDYFPPNVTKFNGYAMHGLGKDRHYEALYPVPQGADRPDFHALEYFRALDFTSLVKGFYERELPQLWRDACQWIQRYIITTTWNGTALPSEEHITLTLQRNKEALRLNVSAPFYDDPPPEGEEENPLYGLWEYEVAEMYFLNDKNEYLELQVGPWGQHLLLMLNGERNIIKHSLDLDYVVTERVNGTASQPGRWHGSALIPASYFPPNVTLMNAYAIHGTGDSRVYEALYPAPHNDPQYSQPDFHRLELFKNIDFDVLLPAEYGEYSALWEEVIENTTATTNSTDDPDTSPVDGTDQTSSGETHGKTPHKTQSNPPKAKASSGSVGAGRASITMVLVAASAVVVAVFCTWLGVQ